MTKTEFRAARMTLGLTQTQFAARLGYASRYIVTHKESGYRPVTARDALQVADLLALAGRKTA